ncbi:MAG: response regulator [Coriobacteriia bacterium]|nr:response regulator [Coriobacteriia bacterium]
MTILIYTIIYAGTALMAYNIVRYYQFIRRIGEFGGAGRAQALVRTPFILLIAFLVGYLAVALFGEPDLVIAGILFGGSIFVSIVLKVLIRIIDRLNESNRRAQALYEQVQSNLENLTKDYLAIYRINLTRDIVEERRGKFIVEEQESGSSYTELLSKMRRNLAGQAALGLGQGNFSRDALITCFREGHTSRQEAFLCLFQNGEVGYVKMTATLATEPTTGDILAFITLAPCNDEVVTDALMDKALIEQYDMITSLVGRRYRVLIGDADSGKPGSIFPREKEGDYFEYLTTQVAPVIMGTPEEKIATMSSLGIVRVERELAKHEPYTVNIACEIDGQAFYKRFSFYVVDAAAHFYLLLKSDTTELRREEQEQNRILEEALSEARRASKSKSIFLSNISHDIRTPMNAIVGYTGFAQASDDVAQIHDYLGKIDASSKYLLALINDVLEMSRIESGRIDLEPEPTNLPALVAAAHDMFETQAHDRGIAFTADTTRMCNAFVRCDKNRLNRVLLNLLSNAFKFTPDDGTIELTMQQVAPPEDGVAGYELRVKDSGIGMSPEFATRVFDAFERERDATTSGIQGTGLGMAITKRIVDMMDGNIRVVTAPGKGSEFIVSLRFPLQDPNDVECSAALADEGAAETALDFTGKRVLLAEDNEINREIARIILEDMGFALDEAMNGQEAIDMLAAAGPGVYDLVITDIQMPQMDGFAMARAIRALDDPQLSHVPIIAMSANAFQEDVKAGLDAGMDGYVAKPIDVDQLTATLNRVLA